MEGVHGVQGLTVPHTISSSYHRLHHRQTDARKTITILHMVEEASAVYTVGLLVLWAWGRLQVLVNSLCIAAIPCRLQVRPRCSTSFAITCSSSTPSSAASRACPSPL